MGLDLYDPEYKLAFRPNTLFLEKLTHLSDIMRR